MKIFIGYDSDQAEASDVCEFSLRSNSHAHLDIQHIRRDELIAEGLYYSVDNRPASTQFAYTRFLTPYLSNYKGWSMFVDSDFIFTTDITELFDRVYNDDTANTKAMYCVHHPEYVPKHTTKFYDRPQLTFPKKNWSSLMIFNNDHPSTRNLNPESVNRTSPQWLHRFLWLDETTELGDIPITWNWLIGEYGLISTSDDILPKGIHYTNGGPFNEVYGQDYEYVWNRYKSNSRC
tara:strand:- start:2017 stop:2718 length:702 start_codon:yes stop_codon:yes gene_type:complete